MVSKGLAEYEPPKQTRSVLLYWRSQEEWAEALHEWVGYHCLKTDQAGNISLRRSLRAI